MDEPREPPGLNLGVPRVAYSWNRPVPPGWCDIVRYREDEEEPWPGCTPFGRWLPPGPPGCLRPSVPPTTTWHEVGCISKPKCCCCGWCWEIGGGNEPEVWSTGIWWCQSCVDRRVDVEVAGVCTRGNVPWKRKKSFYSWVLKFVTLLNIFY